jgi:tRNA threonylcarbamoyladenosine biosynthesis protein TsaE
MKQNRSRKYNTIHISTSLAETKSIAQNFLQSLSPQKEMATVVFLEGDLGSGKTTFTQAAASLLGVKETVISPTFILEKRYTIKKHPHFKKLIHIDAYRFDSVEEAHVLRIQETLVDVDSLVFIEWPKKLGNNIQPTQTIEFTSLEENHKQITW